MRFKGRYINDRKPEVVPAQIIEVKHDGGKTELHPIEVEAFCFPAIMEKSKKREMEVRKIKVVLGTVGIFGGAAAAVVLMAPALGTVLFALLAWCMFAAAATGE